MTDDNNPKPMKKTSAVPLRKETVRVTLKATPESDGNGGSPGAPPAPAPTVPLNVQGTGAPSVPSPAPTVKLQTGAPTTPAPTVKLQTGAPTTPAPTTTAPMPTETQATMPAPAPTVKLDTPGTPTPAGAISQPLPSAPVQPKAEGKKPFEMDAPVGRYLDVKVSEKSGEAAIVTKTISTQEQVLSVIALVAALIVLGVQLGTANIWVNDQTQENPGWGRLFE